MSRISPGGRRALALTILPLAAGQAQGPAAHDAEGEAWPTRPIRVVVPNAPGGPGDTVFRLLAGPLAASLGQPLLLDHRPGAGNTIGADIVARAAPDGYTLGVGNIASHAVGPSVYPGIGYDPVRDFTPLALLLEIPLALVVRNDSAWRSVADLLAAARSAPAGLSVGTPGNGSASHLQVERLRRIADGGLVHVPFRGGAAALTEVMTGRLDAAMPSLAEAIGNNALRVLAQGGPARLAGWPEIPTFAEAGFPDLTGSAWWCLVAPAGLPPRVAARLRDEAGLALQRRDVAARLAALGALPGRNLSPLELSAFIAAEATRWGGMARSIALRPD